LATSESSVSSPTPATASAEAIVMPPANAPRRANAARSSSSSSRTLHSSVARNVR
jgi:hypothetical protein